jgi:hypothetical protein
MTAATEGRIGKHLCKDVSTLAFLRAGICYTLLASLMFNFLRGAFAPRFQERCTWEDSSITEVLVSAASGSLRALASLLDRHLKGLDPLHTLEVSKGPSA